MKKREKLPEVAAFEQAFGRSARNGPQGSPAWASNSGRSASGKTPVGNAFGTSSGLFSRSQPPSPFSSRLPGQSPQGPRQSTSSGRMRSAVPGPPVGRGVSAGRTPGWGLDDEEDEGDDARWSEPQKPVPARAAGDRFAGVLVSAVLLLVALFAAYSMQSHSERQLVPGAISADGASVSGISYDAGWPLVYAHVDEQQVPLSDVYPSPAFHYVQLLPFALDIVLLSLPLWLLLEAAWRFWGFILERFGPRRPLRRFFAIAFTALPAALWLLAAFGAGVFVGFLNYSNSAWSKALWLALAPAIPGFGLASAASVVLGIPSNLWSHDFGIFLLVAVLPLATLTACFYILFCAIGRGLRKMAKGGSK